ncbi:septal ring lytic transglycosylase RlpA family protein, partial [Fodinibius sp.]|uniref:septal ring lytic transglycosylase RlpA family protein n=1 Tax=Fodinibius sp. TaxID=1872440 RepID=UPI0035628260
MKSLGILVIVIGISLFISSCGSSSRLQDPGSEGPAESKNIDLDPNAPGKKIEEGMASWYGPKFHGRLTANGEQYDMDQLTAAHRTLPFDSIVRVRNLANGESVMVRINDRGPFAKNRIIDLSRKAAREIEMIGPGTAEVALILMNDSLEHPRATDLKTATYTVQL